MRIEEITIEKAVALSDTELYNMRLRAVQIWDKHFAKTATPSSGTIMRSELLGQYEVIKTEMSKRQLRPAWAEIDGYLLRHRMMEGLDPTLIGDIMLEPACVVVGGDFAHDPKGSEVCDLFVSPNIGHGDVFKRALNTRIVKQIGKPVEFHFGQESLGDLHLPLFDLVLRPRATLEKVRGEGMGQGDGRQGDGGTDLCYCPECGTSVIHERGVPCNKIDCPDCGTMMTGVKPTTKSHPNEIVITKPGFDETENEIGYRVRDPGRFEEGSFRRIGLQKKKPRVYAIIGRLKGETTTTIQGLRFPKGDGWTIPKARAWTSAHSSVLKQGTDLMKISAEGDVLEDDVVEKEEKPVDSEFTIRKVDNDEHIVGGIVYEPMVEDADGDYATADDIRKAAHGYMESSQRIKVMHKGRAIRASVIESFLVPVEFVVGEQVIKAGSWWMSVRVDDKEAWTAIKDGEITGFSMGGMARVA